MREGRMESLRSYAHPALAVAAPFLFLQGLDAIMRLGIVPGYGAGPFGSLVVVLLAGASRAVVSNILGRERIAGFIPAARELVVTLAACALVLLLLTGRPFRGDFDPRVPAIAWPLVLCAAQWLLTRFVQEELRARELFLRLVAGKTGHGLASALHDAGGEAGQAHESFMNLRSAAVIFQVFTLLPWIIYEMVRSIDGAPGGGVALTVRVMTSCVAGVLFLGVLHAFVDEHANIGAGVQPADAPGSGRFGAPVAGIAAIFLAAAALGGGRSLVPLSVLLKLLSWLNQLFVMPEGSLLARAQSADQPQQDNTGDLREMLQNSGEPSALLAEILRIAGIVMAVAAAAGFAYFIIRPLLRRGLISSARRFHPLRAAARAVIRLLRALAGLPGALARWLRSPGRSIASIPRAILEALREAGAGAARAREKAARISRSRAVREFLRLSRWGEKNGIVLSKAEAPLEYAARLVRRVPAREAAIREAAVLFERLVYAAEPEPGGERALARLVNGIVR
jgi:hypothetical protein